MTQGQITKNLTVLHEAGIKGQKAKNLARLEWMNEQYIREVIHQVIEIEGQTLGLAIWRMERGNITRLWK